MPFLPERKVEKLLVNLHDKTEYVIYIIQFKLALNHELVLKKIQNAWLKQFIDMNTDLRKKSENHFQKHFLKLLNHAVFGNTSKNGRGHRDIKLFTRERRKNYLVSEPNYHIKKFSPEYLLAIEMKKHRYL